MQTSETRVIHQCTYTPIKTRKEEQIYTIQQPFLKKFLLLTVFPAAPSAKEERESAIASAFPSDDRTLPKAEVLQPLQAVITSEMIRADMSAASHAPRPTWMWWAHLRRWRCPLI